LVKKGFFARNLSELLTVCEELLQRNKNTLVIFTLKGLFQDLFIFYDNPPVTVEREQILTAGLKDKILELLNNISNVSFSSLEDLILLYQNNKAKLEAHSYE
jgi:hypothetical protein